MSLALPLMTFILASVTPFAAAANDKDVNPRLAGLCDPGVHLKSRDRERLLNKLRISKAGRDILAAFESQYGALANLLIQWDSVSYSQVAKDPAAKIAGRSLASRRAPAALVRGRLGAGICVHLARSLPEIENVADLAHELTHATRLEPEVLRGEVADVDQFVHARLSASGGEADAFSVECKVKKEILGRWDDFCGPYASVDDEAIEVDRVLTDLYAGRLSASLTGEAYPVMLARQYRVMLAKRATRQAASDDSALENTASEP